MPYDEQLDVRIARALAGLPTTRKRMFGGTCQLLNGNLLCGVWRDCLVLRLGPDAAAEALRSPHVRPFDITGRPMQGWVLVEPAGVQGDALWDWLERARSFASTLPAK